ncbi:uroporphyrinogen-III synthase [Parasphingorhabdus sp.]|uniref:uroporphyrinogen-III synthase n=1 Tax=Parasphingorhabdus sp. TaxID=2709688 RepID=UPI003D28911B
MTPRLLILRPREGAEETARRAGALGFTAVVDPLFAIEAVGWSAKSVQDYDRLLLTSANAARYAGGGISDYRSLPTLAVGQATADAASEAGLNVVEIGSADAQSLLDDLDPGKVSRILWLAGKQHSALDSGHVKLDIVIVYESKILALGEAAISVLDRETVILLHSQRGAEHFQHEISRLALDRSRHHIAALSKKVAKSAGTGWKSVSIADRPTDDALLSLASGLCRKQ